MIKQSKSSKLQYGYQSMVMMLISDSLMIKNGLQMIDPIKVNLFDQVYSPK